MYPDRSKRYFRAQVLSNGSCQLISIYDSNYKKLMEPNFHECKVVSFDFENKKAEIKSDNYIFKINDRKVFYVPTGSNPSEPEEMVSAWEVTSNPFYF